MKTEITSQVSGSELGSDKALIHSSRRQNTHLLKTFAVPSCSRQPNIFPFYDSQVEELPCTRIIKTVKIVSVKRKIVSSCILNKVFVDIPIGMKICSLFSHILIYLICALYHNALRRVKCYFIPLSNRYILDILMIYILFKTYTEMMAKACICFKQVCT